MFLLDDYQHLQKALRRQKSFQIGGKFIQLLMNHGLMLLKFTSKGMQPLFCKIVCECFLVNSYFHFSVSLDPSTSHGLTVIYLLDHFVYKERLSVP